MISHLKVIYGLDASSSQQDDVSPTPTRQEESPEAQTPKTEADVASMRATRRRPLGVMQASDVEKAQRNSSNTKAFKPSSEEKAYVPGVHGVVWFANAFRDVCFGKGILVVCKSRTTLYIRRSVHSECCERACFFPVNS